ncbi:MAG: hypothetical protein ACXQS2_06505 [Methermicoccaceae archaeon]
MKKLKGGGSLPRRYKCPLCPREFTTKEKELEHFKKEHVGKITEGTVRYAFEMEVPVENMLRHGFPKELVEKVQRELEEEIRQLLAKGVSVEDILKQRFPRELVEKVRKEMVEVKRKVHLVQKTLF